MSSDKIVNLSSSNFEAEVIQSDKPVIVDFWAPWCGPCRMVGPVMDELADEYEGKAKVCKVNVDDEGELAATFKVMSIPTVVLMKDGKIVEKSVGANAKDFYASMIDKNL